MAAYEAEIESDMSVLHRIDDMYQQSADRMLRLAARLPHYQGAVRARAMAERPEPRAAAGPGVDWVPATREGIAGSALAGIVSYGKEG